MQRNAYSTINLGLHAPILMFLKKEQIKTTKNKWQFTASHLISNRKLSVNKMRANIKLPPSNISARKVQ